ncbi:MAG TPA: HlyD family efflux transporter periplasmic adaptor subunit [Holophagaceae bacterium]|nr:HlyD family efflux transporter periplasmic adaptor subunit [Holophagaceae bacterium]
MRTPVLALSALMLLTACHRDSRPSLNGRVEAYLSDLGPRVGGRLLDLKVVEGQRVKAGDLLALVSAEELDAAVLRDRAAVDSAEAKRLELANGSRKEDIAMGEARVKDAVAALKLAEDTLARARRLNADKVLSQADLDRSQADRDRAEANLHLQEKGLAELKAGARSEQRMGATAESQRAKATLQATQATAAFLEVRAPFDGVVVHRLREVGAVLAPGQAVVTLARLDRLWVRVYLPQPIQAQAQVGMPVSIEFGDHRAPLQATLDEVSSDPEYTPKMVETREERVNLVYPARVNIARGWDQGLLPGISVDVRLGAAGK